MIMTRGHGCFLTLSLVTIQVDSGGTRTNSPFLKLRRKTASSASAVSYEQGMFCFCFCSVLLCGRKRLSSSVLLSVWSALIWNGIGDGMDDFG